MVTLGIEPIQDTRKPQQIAKLSKSGKNVSVDMAKINAEVNPNAIHRESSPYESMGLASTKLLETYTEKELEFLVRFHESQIEITKEQIAKLSKSGNDASVDKV